MPRTRDEFAERAERAARAAELEATNRPTEEIDEEDPLFLLARELFRAPGEPEQRTAAHERFAVSGAEGAELPDARD